MVRHCSQRENSAHLGVKGLKETRVLGFMSSISRVFTDCNEKHFLKKDRDLLPVSISIDYIMAKVTRKN